jgi:hypothetical protein
MQSDLAVVMAVLLVESGQASMLPLGRRVGSESGSATRSSLHWRQDNYGKSGAFNTGAGERIQVWV